LQRQTFGALEQRYIDLVYQPIREPDGEISGIFVQGHDVTDACQLAQELSYQASHDPLTGLLNRREFERRVTALLEADAGHPKDPATIEWLTERQPLPAIESEPPVDGVQESRPHVLMYLDLDLFKIINDHCGHGAGDELLRQVSDLLRRHVRSSDILARLGGDEFALVLRRCPMYAAERVANQLRQAVSDLVFIWQGRRYGVSLSVGLAAFGVPLGVSFQVALSQADAACFLAKEKGRNRVQVYRAEDDEAHRQLHDMDWASRLRDCLAEDRVILYVQRIVGLQGERTATPAWEVLARLREPDGNLVAPGVFIPAAERFGLMPTLDRHIIRKAFAMLHELPAHQRDDARYFINVSGRTFSQDDLPSFVQGLLLEFPRLRPEHICFEVTETAAVSNPALTARAMQHLVDQGFRFALDDFGSGMSSFAYLRQLPVQYVKIDGEFVRNILHDPVDSAMVEAVAKVARLMGIQTVAEFVESVEVLDRLVSLGVDYGQGFALHRPQPLADAMAEAHREPPG
ncbi:MAG: putative bifunctional diguanylate cyclase/phosphodiesterase, partial [Pigmentiphaga sp.]